MKDLIGYLKYLGLALAATMTFAMPVFGQESTDEHMSTPAEQQTPSEEEQQAPSEEEQQAPSEQEQQAPSEEEQQAPSEEEQQAPSEEEQQAPPEEEQQAPDTEMRHASVEQGAAPEQTMPSHVTMSAEMRKQVQQALNSHGANLKVDGILGKRSMEALRKFQQQSGLPETGQLDAATLDKLGIK